MNRLGWRGLLAAMLVATLAVALWQADQRRKAADWFAFARQAATRVSYHGELELVVQGGAQSLNSRVEVAHIAPSRSRYRYLGPDLAGVEMLTDGHRAVRTDPMTGRQTMRAAELLNVPLTLAGYQAMVGNGGEIAGRPTVHVRLRRAGVVRELWLDTKLGLPLRTVITQPGGLLTDTRFVSFTPEPPVEPIPALPSDAKPMVSAPVTVAELSRRVGFPVFEPGWLPDGFTLAETRQCSCPCGCQGGTAQLIYSDGVGHISVFYTGEDCQRCYASESACAACTEHQTAVRLKDSAVQVVGYADDKVLVVAIGDARPAELARIASSVPVLPNLH